MEIDIRDLKSAPDGITRHEVIEFPNLPSEHAQIIALTPVNADVEAHLGPNLYEVDGVLDFTVTYRCSRCLEPFDSAQQADLTESFTEDPGRADDDVHLAPQGTMNLNPYIEQSVNLSFEFFPVCRRDCKGLCPVCGVNRNETACNCDARTVDPRLAALGDLLSEGESE